MQIKIAFHNQICIRASNLYVKIIEEDAYVDNSHV